MRTFEIVLAALALLTVVAPRRWIGIDYVGVIGTERQRIVANAATARTQHDSQSGSATNCVQPHVGMVSQRRGAS